MGVWIHDENGWHDESGSDQKEQGPEYGKRPQDPEKLPFPEPQLQIVPTEEEEREQNKEPPKDKWHPGLGKEPIKPPEPAKKGPSLQ